MASALGEAQDEIGAILAADATIKKMWKGIGAPLQLETYLEAVWISGEVDQWTQDYQISNLAQKDEAFTIRVHCLQTVIGDFVKARNSCLVLSGQVETLIKAHQVDLTSHVKLVGVGAGSMEESRLDDRRHQVLITLFVNCTAWLSA